MIEIGFTGTRLGMTIAQHAALVKIMLSYHKMSGTFKWHHGVCVGADEQCHNLATIFDFYIQGHPPLDERYQATLHGFDIMSIPKDYIVRNHEIVDACSILIATPKEMKEVIRSGTWATIRYAKGTGVKVVRIDPFGDTHI